tara:strand:+ start:305 stop:415 length:111 start_codon:yes stop_codon:yes gene_type:complete
MVVTDHTHLGQEVGVRMEEKYAKDVKQLEKAMSGND